MAEFTTSNTNPLVLTRGLFAAARESGYGTFETCRWRLTKSVIGGKADLPVAHSDFSV